MRPRAPACSLMKIVQMYGHKMDTKHTPIVLLEVNVTGLRFCSSLKLPINENVVWSFQFQLQGELPAMEGIITSCRETEAGSEYVAKWASTPSSEPKGMRMAEFREYNVEEWNAKFERATQSYSHFHDPLPYKQQVDFSC